MPRCCVPFCNSNSIKKNSTESFHEFPADIDLLNAWLKVISRKDFVPNDKSPTSVVCSRHFKASDFIHHKTRKCLKKGTIPSVFSEYLANKQPQVNSDQQIQKRNNEVYENVLSKTSEIMSPSKLDHHNLLKDFSNTSLDLQCETSATSMISKQEEIINKHTQHTKKEANENVVSKNSKEMTPSRLEHHNLLTDFSNTSLDLRYETARISKQNPTRNKCTQTKITCNVLRTNKVEMKRLRRLLSARDKQIDSLQNKLSEAMEKLSYFKKNSGFQNLEKMNILHDAGVGTNQVEFVLNQVNNFDKKKPRWPDNILRECVLFHATSPEGYHHVQKEKILNLPSTKTLHRFIMPANDEVGLTSLIKEDSTKEANKLHLEKDCVSLIDEMGIKPECIYNPDKDQFFDFQSEKT